MKIIAHRGNLDGPCPETENNPEQINKCLDFGYDVEVDVRWDPATDRIWLGHDDAQNMVSWYWLANRSQYLWVHCKDIATLHAFSTKTSGYNYFWHQHDDYALTSKHNIWSYPNQTYTSNTVIVMPELNNLSPDLLKVTNCFGICSDYPQRYR